MTRKGPRRFARFELRLEFLNEEQGQYGSEFFHSKINEAYKAVEYFRPIIADLPVERAEVLALNTQMKPIRGFSLSKGVLNSCAIGMRELFQNLCQANAAAFILAHNHPSGDPSPSKADLEITKKIATAAKIFGIKFCDHIIVGHGNSFYSIFDNCGYLFEGNDIN